MTPVRTIFFGSGAFGIESLRALDRAHKSGDVELVGVVTAAPKPAGRRGDLRPTAIDDAAGRLAVPNILRPDRLQSSSAIAEVLALEPGLAVLADYGQLVPGPILDLAFGALNLHPSLLPRHRGATPIQSAILAGDDVTGVTLFRMDAGLDTGPIVARVRHPLDGSETTPELEARLGSLAAALLVASLPDWTAGRIRTIAQDDSAATLTRPLRRDDGRLDPQRGALALERQVRAYQPWPGSWFEALGGRIIVWRAEPVAARQETADAPVGQMETDGIVTADGLLRLLDVQPAGGRRMTWQALLRGRPELVGTRLGS